MYTLQLLIKNQWKESFRSPMWQRNIIINVVLGLFILYMVAAFALLGFVIDKVLLELYPDSDPIIIFNGFLLFYFLIDLVGRFIFDSLPTLSLQPLLHLPVNKKMLVHYILIRSKFSFFNWAPLLLLLPFAFKLLPAAHGWLATSAWIVSILCAILINNYLGAYLKRMINQNMKVVAGFLLVIALLGAAEYFDILELSVVSNAIWGTVLSFPALASIFLVILIGMYWVNFQMLYANTYLEEIHTKKGPLGGEIKALSFLEKFGEIGRLAMLEIKLITRSKRPRSIMMMGGFMLFYGALFFPNPIYLEDGWGMLMFASIFTTGGFAITYAQYFFAWESSYFDGMLIQRIDLHKYISAKLLLTAAPVFVAYLFSLLYGFIAIKLIAFLTAAMLFNIGVALFIMLWLATFNNKRLDVSQKASFNWQGVGATQFIAMIPVMVVPAGTVALCGYFGIGYVGIAIVGALGIIGIIFHKVWIDLIVQQLVKKKYFMASGYRKE